MHSCNVPNDNDSLLKHVLLLLLLVVDAVYCCYCYFFILFKPNIYSSKFHSVPVLQIYFEEIMDTKTDFRLSRDAISMLVRLLGIKKRHSWNPVAEVLVFLFWFGNGASCSVVSHVFSIPKTSVFRIVHSIALKVVALRTNFLNLRTLTKLEKDLPDWSIAISSKSVWVPLMGAMLE